MFPHLHAVHERGTAPNRHGDMQGFRHLFKIGSLRHGFLGVSLDAVGALHGVRDRERDDAFLAFAQRPIGKNGLIVVKEARPEVRRGLRYAAKVRKVLVLEVVAHGLGSRRAARSVGYAARWAVSMLGFLVACGGSQTISIGGAGDTGTELHDTAPHIADSADSLPASGVVGEVTMEPEGGAFVGSTFAALTIEGEGSLEWCQTDDPEDDACSWAAYTAPVEVDRSVILRARAVLDGDSSDIITRTFVEISAGLSGFTSTLPVLLFWTDGQAPTSDTDVGMGLLALEPEEGGVVALLGTPSNNGRARLHARGSSSADFPKHAYDMELWEGDAKVDRRDVLVGMPENGDWILYAPYYYDDALVRNPLAMSLSVAVGRYAPRTRMVEVFVGERGSAVDNDDYVGVYVLMEEIEVDAERVAITPLLPEDGAEPEVTGGYLFKVDRTGDGESGFYAGSAGGEFSFQQNFVAVEPTETELSRAQASYLADRVDDVGWAVASGEDYDAVMDVDSFIDHHIVNVVMKNPDAFRLSGYMHQNREGLLVAGPVWDFDRTAGSADSRSTDPRWWDNSNVTSDCTYVFEFGWYKGLFDDPEFAERYWSRFDSVLRNELSVVQIDAMLDGFAVGLDEPAARNGSRWGSASFSSEFKRLRDWMHDRHDWMSSCIASYPDPRDCPG